MVTTRDVPLIITPHTSGTFGSKAVLGSTQGSNIELGFASEFESDVPPSAPVLKKIRMS